MEVSLSSPKEPEMANPEVVTLQETADPFLDLPSCILIASRPTTRLNSWQAQRVMYRIDDPQEGAMHTKRIAQFCPFSQKMGKMYGNPT